MLRVSASHYVHVGESIAKIKPLLDPPEADWFEHNAQLADDKISVFFEGLADIKWHCERLQLAVTSGLVQGFIEKYPAGIPTLKEANVFMAGMTDTFKVELSRQAFFYVLPHRVPYVTSVDSPSFVGFETQGFIACLTNFPDAQFDAIEAGCCFAFERFTASVYHLMRVAEHGLVAVSRSVGAQDDDLLSWEKMLGKIHSEMKLLAGTKPVPNWKDEEKKLADLCAWFESIKTGWRNPVSHVPRTYSEGTARSLFHATRTLFEHLTVHGFRQATMPTVIASP